MHQLSMTSGKVECYNVPGRVSPATSCVPVRVDLADLRENGTPVLLMTIYELNIWTLKAPPDSGYRLVTKGQAP